MGPRPALPAEVATYDDYRHQRLLVKPGITCFWQTRRNRGSIAFDEWVDLGLWQRPLKEVLTLSGSDSNAMVQKTYRVGLKDGKIAFEGVGGFSIDIEDPKLNVGKLYSALFADVNEPTTISLEPAIELKQDRKASSFFESLKKIVDGACEKMNPGLAEIAKKAEGLDADDEAKRS